jgi:DNA replication protein DnaC
MSFLEKIEQPEPILSQLLHYAAHPFGFLLLAGTNGTGKTFAAKAIYHKNTDYILPEYNQEKAIFIKQPDMNIEWMSKIANGQSIEYFLQDLVKTKLLVIDDLGTRTPTESFMDFLYVLIDKRWERRQKTGTIITTNLSEEDFRKKFGDAVFSRAASGMCLRIDGADKRFK